MVFVSFLGVALGTSMTKWTCVDIYNNTISGHAQTSQVGSQLAKKLVEELGLSLTETGSHLGVFPSAIAKNHSPLLELHDLANKNVKLFIVVPFPHMNQGFPTFANKFSQMPVRNILMRFNRQLFKEPDEFIKPCS